jgi:hypothetical protein
MFEYGVATTCNKDLYVEVTATQTVNERNNSCRLFFFMEVQLEEERITFTPQVPPGTSIHHHTVQERIFTKGKKFCNNDSIHSQSYDDGMMQ